MAQQHLHLLSIQRSFLLLPPLPYHPSNCSLSFLQSHLSFIRCPFPSSSTLTQSHGSSSRILTRALLSQDQFHIPPNAFLQKTDPKWRGGFSLGVDLGLSRTGVALSKGFSIRPLTVLELRGQKLELQLLDIAEQEEVDEFIIGLPKSADGKETVQSNKVRSVAGRLAVRAAERGWRVYLQDEYGTSIDALDFMIDMDH